MDLNINVFVLLLGLFQGVLIAFFLLRRPQNRTANLFLSAYVLVLIVQILFKVAHKVWLRENLLWWYDIAYHLPLLYAPLIYLYIKHYLSVNKSLNISVLWHFLPFAAILIIQSFYAFFPRFFWLIFKYEYKFIIQLLSLSIYTWLSYQLLNHWKKQFPTKISANKPQLRWLGTLNQLNFGLGASVSFGLMFLYATHPHYFEYRFLFLTLTVFVYWLSYQAIANPLIFNGLQNDLPEKYAHSSLSASEAQFIFNELVQLMNQKKPYLDPDLNIQKLASRLQINKHSLSQVLNEVAGKNYYDFVNEYRVKEAQKLLQNPDKQHFTIAALAYEAGFNSLSAFNEIFKKQTQLTPSQFRKRLLILD
jgi:AraC-like DNA-binding protein